MTDSLKPYILLVGIDYSSASALALQTAITLTYDHEAAELHVMHVIASHDQDSQTTPESSLPPSGNNSTALEVRLARAYEQLNSHVAIGVAEFAKSHPRLPMTHCKITSHLRHSEPAHELAQLAVDIQADLVVVGIRGQGKVSRFLLGSVAESTARLSPCSVLVVRPKGLPTDYPKIEPPCPKCVETRIDSNGEQFWCEQHRERHGQRHFYFQTDLVGQQTNFPLVFR